MRWIYLATIILFAAATTVFVLQNFQAVTISFSGLDARTPLALLVAVATCWGQPIRAVAAFLRRSRHTK